MSNVNSIAGERLRSFIERIERLDEEITGLNGDKREVYAEAKGVGFDPKVMKAVLKIRRMDPADHQEQDMLLDTYLRALDMLPENAG